MGWFTDWMQGFAAKGGQTFQQSVPPRRGYAPGSPDWNFIFGPPRASDAYLDSSLARANANSSRQQATLQAGRNTGPLNPPQTVNAYKIWNEIEGGFRAIGTGMGASAIPIRTAFRTAGDTSRMAQDVINHGIAAGRQDFFSKLTDTLQTTVGRLADSQIQKQISSIERKWLGPSNVASMPAGILGGVSGGGDFISNLERRLADAAGRIGQSAATGARVGLGAGGGIPFQIPQLDALTSGVKSIPWRPIMIGAAVLGVVGLGVFFWKK